MDRQACQILTEGLRSNDLSIRIDSFSKLHLLAEAMGPERTRDELLQYLLEFSDDEDAVIAEIINQLATIIPYIGGPEYIQYTFDLFQTFMLLDEHQVRNRAVEVFISFLPQLDYTQIIRFVLPVVRHLVLSEWHVGRLSVATLLPHIYPLCQRSLQNEICSIFSALALDEHPIVRKQICLQFGLFATFCLHDPKLAKILYHLVIHASKDIQDSVRMAAVDSCIIVSDVLRHYNAQHKALIVLFSLATDVSWRVRYIVAQRYPLILASLDMSTFTGDETAENFARLLQDHEAEVRTAAAGVLGRVCCLLGPDKTSRYLIGLFKVCAEDLHDAVRIALSRDFLYTCNTLPQYVVNETILPLFQQLLADQRSEVKLNLISNLHMLTPHVTEESLFKTMLPAIIELSQHTNWRIRVNVTTQYVILATQLSQQTFLERFMPIALCQLCDPVASVRYGAIANFFKFTIVYGSQWAQSHLLPRLEILSQHQSFTHRLSAALALTGLLQLFPLEAIRTTIYPLLTSLLNDRVTNIQLLALRGVALVLSRLVGFASSQNLWLGHEQIFSFQDESENNGSADSSGTPSNTHLILQVLLHNLRHRAFWEQTQYMLPVATEGKIALIDNKGQVPHEVSYSTPAGTPQKAPLNKINVSSGMMNGPISADGSGGPLHINNTYVSSSALPHKPTQPHAIPSVHSFLTGTQPAGFGALFGSNQMNGVSENEHGAILPHDAFSDLIGLIDAPAFNLSEALADKTMNYAQSSLDLANATAKENGDSVLLDDSAMKSTVYDSSIALRDFMTIINLFVKKSSTNQSVLGKILQSHVDLGGDSPEKDLPTDPQQQSLTSQTVPFHLLSVSLNPSSGSGSSGAGNSASGPSVSKQGTELYVFLLLKRLREDYRRIIRETINVILLKLKDVNGIGAAGGEEISAASGVVENEGTLLAELNHLRVLLTAQYSQDLRQDRYLFHITPAIYQLQQQKNALLTDLSKQDSKIRSESTMIEFKTQLMTDLERFRTSRGRGTNELVVFANETLHLIQQLSTPLMQAPSTTPIIGAMPSGTSIAGAPQ